MRDRRGVGGEGGRGPGRIDPEDLAELLGRWADGDGMLTVSLADGLAELITGGVLPAGVVLPAARPLGEALRVSRSTVSGAYDLLHLHGLVDKRTRQVSRQSLVDESV